MVKTKMTKYKLVCEGSITRKEADLKLILEVYNFGFWFDGNTGILQLDDGKVIAVIDTDGKYRIYSHEESNCIEHAEKLEWMLGVHEDLTGFYNIASHDPLLREFAEKYRGWKLRSTSLWWGLVIGVCQQNASFRQGWTMLYKIIKNYEKKIRINDIETYLIPSPKDILENTKPLLMSKTGYRAKTIIEIAKWAMNNYDLIQEFQQMNSKEIEETLKKIKGVGAYTARLALVLGLRRYDLPPIDRWLKRIISTVYGVPEKDAEKIWVEKWNKYSGLAAIAVTIALDAEPLRGALRRISRKLLTPTLRDKSSPLTIWKYYS